MSDLHIKVPGDKDRRAWGHLYQQYAGKYNITLSDEQLERVWSWIRTPMHPLEAILIQNDLTQTLAMIHCHTSANILTGRICGILDDLFVVAEQRQNGLASALLYGLTSLGQQREWESLSWHCAEDDYVARTLFDQHATMSASKLYELDITPKIRPFSSTNAYVQQIEVTALDPDDKIAWKHLFTDFLKTQHQNLPQETIELIWSWIINPDTLVMGLIAREESGRAVALSLFHPFPDPLSARTAAKIDCFYVTPEAQGTGCADLLLHHTVKQGQQQQWCGFQWTIHQQHYQARQFFDKRTTLTDFVQYQTFLSDQTES